MTKIRVRPKLSVAADCDDVVVELNNVRARMAPAAAVYAAEFVRGTASRPDYVDQECSLDVQGGDSSLKLACVRAPDNPPLWRQNTALRMTARSAGKAASAIVTQSELGLLALALERAALLAATVESEVSR